MDPHPEAGMELIDSHTHIYLAAFDADRAAAIARAQGQGVTTMLMPNVDGSTVEALLRVAQAHGEACKPLMGLHPTSVGQDPWPELGRLLGLFDRHQFLGVGEIGIDLYWETAYRGQQEEVFREQLRFAKKAKLPVVIHSRQAMELILRVVDQEHDSALRGIFHCFAGDAHHYQHIARYGTFLIGVGGVVTYRNSSLAKLLRGVRIDHIALETDAPYLTPAPFRGQRNESQHLVHIARRVAEALELPVGEVARITTANVKAMFGL